MTTQQKIEQFKTRIEEARGKDEEGGLIIGFLDEYVSIIGADAKIYIERLQQPGEEPTAHRYRAWALYYQAMFLRMKGEYGDSIDLTRKALALFESINEIKGIAAYYLSMGHVNYLKGCYNDALIDFNKALKLNEEANYNKGIATAYNGLGNVYEMLANFPESLQNHFLALKLREEAKDMWGIAASHNNLGNVYTHQRNYPKALENYYALIEPMKETGSKNGIATAFGNIGIIYHIQKDYPNALKNYHEALKLWEEVGSKPHLAQCYANIATVNDEMGEYTEVLKYYEKALQVGKEMNDKQVTALSYMHVGNGNEKLGFYAEALKNYKTALSLSEEMGYKDVSMHSAQSMVNVYKALKDYDNALKYYEIYHKVESEILGEKAQEQLTDLNFQHNLEQKEKDAEINRLKYIELEAKNEQIENEMSRARLKAMNAQLSPHFIFNMLSSIRSFVLENKGDANDFIVRVSNFFRGVLNRSDLDVISLHQEVADLENYILLEQMRFLNRFSYQIKIAPGIDAEEVPVPPLIFQPIVENSILHGFNGIEYEGMITIDIKKDGDTLICELSDNGVGFKPKKQDDRKSFGTQLTRDRIELFNRKREEKAVFDIKEQDQGVKVVLHLPLN